MAVRELTQDLALPDGKLDYEEILVLVPHGPKAMFVDRVLVSKGRVLGRYLFDESRCEMFQDHFPSKPILMGVLMQEIIQQTAMAGLAIGYQIKFVRALGADRVRYYREVASGQTLLTVIDRIEQDRVSGREFTIHGMIYFAEEWEGFEDLCMMLASGAEDDLKPICEATLLATVIARPR